MGGRDGGLLLCYGFQNESGSEDLQHIQIGQARPKLEFEIIWPKKNKREQWTGPTHIGL